MTQEEKELLLKDLCGRLRYGVKILDDTFKKYGASELINMGTDGSMLIDNKTNDIQYYPIIDNIKPYLRPMSSITEEEKEELYQKTGFKIDDYILGLSAIDWLNAHHFDYRGLIGKGLALEAPEGMYKTK